VLVVLGAAGILHHSVQRDELGYDDLPHDFLLESRSVGSPLPTPYTRATKKPW
jgi:hypothetical protein